MNNKNEASDALIRDRHDRMWRPRRPTFPFILRLSSCFGARAEVHDF